MSLVVRCPACLGASRVSPEALGEVVACPRCQVPFVAVEDVPVIQPRPRPVSAGASRPAAAVPVAPRRRRLLEPDEYEPAGSSDPSTAEAHPVPDPEHDPHLPPPAGLPVSVLVGLALLPLVIPILWWAAPMLTGQAAALSLAVPVALAFATSTLCLGVVYTIDWSAATRVKGVLMLVGLAYLSAAGLYFLKKELVDGIQRMGRDDPWRFVESKEGAFKVKMPGPPEVANDQPLPQVKMTGGKRATYQTDLDDEYLYLVTAGTPEKRLAEPDAAWFDAVGDHLAKGGKVMDHRDVTLLGHRGHQWLLKVGEGSVRVVRVAVIDGRVYYLSVEGRNVTPTDEDFVDPFFRSFEVLKPGDKPKGKNR
jgi:hypothetical protein